MKYLLILKTTCQQPSCFFIYHFHIDVLESHVFETRAFECRQICQIKLELKLRFKYDSLLCGRLKEAFLFCVVVGPSSSTSDTCR